MKVLCFCILLQLQQPVTNKIANFSNYFGIFKEDKGEKTESAHEIYRISDGCGCAKKKSPMRVKSSSPFLLCCMRSHCKNNEIHVVTTLRDRVATGYGQDI